MHGHAVTDQKILLIYLFLLYFQTGANVIHMICEIIIVLLVNFSEAEKKGREGASGGPFLVVCLELPTFIIRPWQWYSFHYYQWHN